MSTADISVAVTETQGVLELVADRLSVDGAIDAHDAFTLHLAVRAAISRIDSIHDVLQVMEAMPVTALATTPEAMQ